MAMTIDAPTDVRPEPGGHPSVAQQKQPRRPRGVVKDVVLAVAGLAGLLSILWLIASLVLGVSIIVFKTGSMAPTIPAGSLAITRPLAAADIAVGQVVTVAVPGQTLPVTHRVVSVEREGSSPERTIVLKGDDNALPDPVPYHVTKVGLVVFSAPTLGTALVVLRTPIFLGFGTLVITALVVWAFWPERTSRHAVRARRTRRGGAQLDFDRSTSRKAQR